MDHLKPIIEFADIEAAAGRIAGHVQDTPFLESRTISELTGARVTTTFGRSSRQLATRVRTEARLATTSNSGTASTVPSSSRARVEPSARSTLIGVVAISAAILSRRCEAYAVSRSSVCASTSTSGSPPARSSPARPTAMPTWTPSVSSSCARSATRSELHRVSYAG